MSFFREQIWPYTLAIVVHVALVAFLFINVDWNSTPVRPVLNADVVQAVVIDESKIKAEQSKLQKAEEKRKQEERDRQKRAEDEKKKIAELEQKRKETEQKVREAEKKQAEAEKQREAEQKKVEQVRIQREKEEKERQAKAEADKKRKAEEEKKKKEAEAKKRKEEEARKLKEEAERKKKEEAEKRKREQEERMRQAKEDLDRQMAKEFEALDAEANRQQARLLDIYKESIRQHVQRYWRQSPGMQPGMSCKVRVTQLPSGDVLDATPFSCSTPDANFQKSVVDAVLKSSPLPKPPDSALYERVIEFTFEPGK